jgi:hypothetical protein
VNELFHVRPTLRDKIFMIISDSNILRTCGFSLGSDVYKKFYFPMSTDLKHSPFWNFKFRLNVPPFWSQKSSLLWSKLWQRAHSFTYWKLLNGIFMWHATYSSLRYINNLTYDTSTRLWFLKECIVGFIQISSTTPVGNFNTYLESIILWHKSDKVWFSVSDLSCDLYAHAAG